MMPRCLCLLILNQKSQISVPRYDTHFRNSNILTAFRDPTIEQSVIQNTSHNAALTLEAENVNGIPPTVKLSHVFN